MSKTVKVPDTVYSTAEDLRDERDFASLGEAIRWMCREGGYDV